MPGPGRPTTYTQEIATEICARMSQGLSIRTICKADDMPASSTIYLWLATHKAFSEQYTRASVERAHALAEEALEIADDSNGDVRLVERDGETVEVQNHEFAARSRLRVDTRKWFAAKLAPKVYGDRTVLAGDKDEPVTIGLVGLKEILADKLTKAAG